MSKKTTSQSQIEDQAHYYKIGRLRKPIAEKIHRKAADIYIDDNHLKHIFIKHKNEFESTPLLFVDLIINSFNRIYKNKDNEESLLLVRWNGSAKVAVIEMNMVFSKGFYEIKTAFIKPQDRFKESDLLWKKD